MNWLHIGSERASPWIAAIISIVETCGRLSPPVRNYLGSILPGLASFPIDRIAELTPTPLGSSNLATCRIWPTSGRLWIGSMPALAG